MRGWLRRRRSWKARAGFGEWQSRLLSTRVGARGRGDIHGPIPPHRGGISRRAHRVQSRLYQVSPRPHSLELRSLSKKGALLVDRRQSVPADADSNCARIVGCHPVACKEPATLSVLMSVCGTLDLCNTEDALFALTLYVGHNGLLRSAELYSGLRARDLCLD